jgi:hypothetical protein
VVKHLNYENSRVRMRVSLILFNLKEKAVNELYKELSVFISLIHRITFLGMKCMSTHDMLCAVRKTGQKESYKQDGNQTHIF